MRQGRILAALGVVFSVIAGYIAWANVRDESPLDDTPPATNQGRIERGKYLTLAGNCMACHTARGGIPYAGGRQIKTPFGSVYSTNLTPDREHGLGSWAASHFWRALHNGRSKDGRLLYPVFPYPHYTRITREDSDMMFAYLQSLPAVPLANRNHELRWPFNTQWALAIWRAVYFKPEAFRADPSQSKAWNRGAYLVRGLTHCGGCHATRNLLGGATQSDAWRGGVLDESQWYAPSLHDPHEASVAQWETADIVQLLSAGRTDRAVASGPMAEVVFRSTQHLEAPDLEAIATFLKSIPQDSLAADPQNYARDPATMESGEKLYRAHCEGCHGLDGQGAPGAYPALAANRAVVAERVTNVIAAMVHGGFGASTAATPRPYGMPPYIQKLSQREIAHVLTYIRGSWGNNASPVSEMTIQAYLHGTLQ